MWGRRTVAHGSGRAFAGCRVRRPWAGAPTAVLPVPSSCAGPSARQLGGGRARWRVWSVCRRGSMSARSSLPAGSGPREAWAPDCLPRPSPASSARRSGELGHGGAQRRAAPLVSPDRRLLRPGGLRLLLGLRSRGGRHLRGGRRHRSHAARRTGGSPGHDQRAADRERTYRGTGRRRGGGRRPAAARAGRRRSAVRAGNGACTRGSRLTGRHRPARAGVHRRDTPHHRERPRGCCRRSRTPHRGLRSAEHGRRRGRREAALLLDRGRRRPRRLTVDRILLRRSPAPLHRGHVDAPRIGAFLRHRAGTRRTPRGRTLRLRGTTGDDPL